VATITVPGILDNAEIVRFDLDESDQSLTIVRGIDAASPQLQLACTEGSTVGEVTLTIPETWLYPNSMVAAYEADGEYETVTFNYELAPKGPQPIQP
jgi:hypothetical protein